MKLEVRIDYNNPYQTNEIMRELAYILFPQGQRLPMPYTVDSNSTHYIVEIDDDQVKLTPEQEHQLLLWKLKH